MRGPFDFDDGLRRRPAAARPAEPPTVIVCGNDVVALGALNAAGELGVGVPDEVSMVGFDDLPASRPGRSSELTTVAFDLDAMAREAARPAGRTGSRASPDRRLEHVASSRTSVRREPLSAAAPG